MTRNMYDAITPSRIPDPSPQMVGGYVGGNWPDYDELVNRFPGAVHVSIAPWEAFDAQVLDVETGDATPAGSVGWALRQRARGQTPTVYCNTSTWPEVVAAFNTAGVALPLWWAAQYDEVPRMMPGAIAKQHTNTPGYDLSIVADYWPGVDPSPVPSPPAPPVVPVPTAEDEIMVLFDTPAGIWLLLPATGYYSHVSSPPDVDALVAVGARYAPGHTLTQSQHDLFVAQSGAVK